MDRLLRLLGFSCGYAVLAILNNRLNTPPSSLSPRKKRDFLGQHISFLHSINSIFLCLYVYISEGGLNYNAPTNDSHIIVISVTNKQHSIGYFFYDTIYAEIFQLHDWAMRIHHICVLAGGTIMLMADIGGSISTSNF